MREMGSGIPVVSVLWHVIIKYLSNSHERNVEVPEVLDPFFMMNLSKLAVEHGYQIFQLVRSLLVHFKMHSTQQSSQNWELFPSNP
jgi:hypothetical protein